MVDNVSYLKSQFIRQQVTGTRLEESLNVALLMSFLSNLNKFHSVYTSMNTLPENIAFCVYVRTLVIGEEE